MKALSFYSVLLILSAWVTFFILFPTVMLIITVLCIVIMYFMYKNATLMPENYDERPLEFDERERDNHDKP